MSPRTVVFCADANVEVGLHVAARSCLDHASADLRIYVICTGMKAGFSERLEETLGSDVFNSAVRIIEFQPSKFKGLLPIHGSLYAYTVLSIAELVEEDQAIYLDCDTVCTEDILKIPALGNNDEVKTLLAAVEEGEISTAFESQFFKDIGFSQDEKFFNSGVLVMDLAGWRRERASEECLEFARRHRHRIWGDQTVLNAVFRNRVTRIPAKWNILTWPGSAFSGGAKAGIYHFVGKPKPWEPLGDVFVSHYEIFSHVLNNTCFKNKRLYSLLTAKDLKYIVRYSRRFLGVSRDRWLRM